MIFYNILLLSIACAKKTAGTCGQSVKLSKILTENGKLIMQC